MDSDRTENIDRMEIWIQVFFFIIDVCVLNHYAILPDSKPSQDIVAHFQLTLFIIC